MYRNGINQRINAQSCMTGQSFIRIIHLGVNCCINAFPSVMRLWFEDSWELEAILNSTWSCSTINSVVITISCPSWCICLCLFECAFVARDLYGLRLFVCVSMFCIDGRLFLSCVACAVRLSVFCYVFNVYMMSQCIVYNPLLRNELCKIIIFTIKI